MHEAAEKRNYVVDIPTSFFKIIQLSDKALVRERFGWCSACVVAKL